MAQNDTKSQFTPLEAKRWKIWTEAKDRGYTDEQIAKELFKRTRNVVSRLKRKAKSNGAYLAWLEENISWASEEFRELHKKVKRTNPELCYVTTGKIVERQIRERVESYHKEEVDIKKHIVVEDVSDSEDEILSEAARILTRKRKSGSLH